MPEGIFLAEIVLDTGVIIGYGWVRDETHQYCRNFFEEYHAESNTYYYPRKVKEELKYVRDRIARKHRNENELRRMYQFIDEFLRDAQKIDYEKSTECNWDAILVVTTKAMKRFQQTSLDRISFDANHIAHYVCFSRERKDCPDHFFVTTDKNLYNNGVMIQKAVCKAFDEQIQINMKLIWHFASQSDKHPVQY